MRQLAIIILGLGASLILFEGCKKYPEGPAISLRSKKERVANTWKLDQLKSHGVDSTAYYTNILKDYTVSLTKSGSYTISYYVAVPNFGNVTNTESGDWSFSSGKEDLKITPKSITFGSVPSPSVLQILKLYEKELWLRTIDANGTDKEYHFSPK